MIKNPAASSRPFATTSTTGRATNHDPTNLVSVVKQVFGRSTSDALNHDFWHRLRGAGVFWGACTGGGRCARPPATLCDPYRGRSRRNRTVGARGRAMLGPTRGDKPIGLSAPPVARKSHRLNSKPTSPEQPGFDTTAAGEHSGGVLLPETRLRRPTAGCWPIQTLRRLTQRFAIQ